MARYKQEIFQSCSILACDLFFVALIQIIAPEYILFLYFMILVAGVLLGHIAYCANAIKNYNAIYKLHSVARKDCLKYEQNRQYRKEFLCNYNRITAGLNCGGAKH